MLEVKVERCAGIDVHKKFVMVRVMIGLAHQKPTSEVRRFGTNVPDLERLRAWLLEKTCTEVVMGEHWIVLETGVQYFGARLQSDPGKRGKGEGAARQEDRSKRQPVVSGYCFGMG